MVTARFRALLALHGAVVLFGFAGLFGKWLALSPLLIVFGRALIAAATLCMLRRSENHSGKLCDPWLIGTGVVLALHWVAFFAAIQVGTVALGLLGFSSFPLFVLMLERMWFGRHWTRREGISGSVVAIGLVLLVPGFSIANHAVQSLLWGLLSGLTFALLAVMNRRMAERRSAVNVALGQNLWAAVALLPILLFATTSVSLALNDIALLLVLGVLCTALSHTLFITALKHVSASTAAVVAALEPVYGIALAYLFLSEVPSLRTLCGGALIVGAAIWASSARTELS